MEEFYKNISGFIEQKTANYSREEKDIIQKELADIDFAENAAKRAIPLRPVCKIYTDDTRCPSCGRYVLAGSNYCCECGQKLLWHLLNAGKTFQ